jgi:hypothetical protein
MLCMTLLCHCGRFHNLQTKSFLVAFSAAL